MGIPRLAIETLPLAALGAYATDEIKAHEARDAVRVARLEASLTDEERAEALREAEAEEAQPGPAKAPKISICEATWGDVQVGNVVLVPHGKHVVKAEITGVEKGAHSVLIDYVYCDKTYYALFFPPSETAFIQQG